MNGDAIDPENLPQNPQYTPAFVQVREQGPVYVADYETLASGWLRITEWEGHRVKLPPHKVAAIREVRTEAYGDRSDPEGLKVRVADEERREQASADDSAGKAVVADD
ncbi:hypothetical protein JZX76_11415 [Haloarcula hispanica]|uniref:Uncharacterized protein n=1 Tax=Haloarcula hispanica TaxID=51589 RepID=A0A482T298_HALHI|nr:hypothetical protein [Haloarcula hispanica]MCJ0620095.1 hypothetical protein [Haloarcula hispanica]RYJ10528.1 hypothetical protein ELS20_11345 [Haloarcula hispanica]